MENRQRPSNPDLAPLEEDIQNFFDANLHLGFRRAFVLDYLKENQTMKALAPGLTTYMTILKNIDDEDLPGSDPQYNAGLQAVGSRWEAVLRIPYWYYEK